MTYQEQLQDTRWFLKRDEILQRDNNRCQDCLRKDSELHVHHKQYIDGKMAWEYPNELLITLCSSCHKAFHTYDFRPDRERPWRLYEVPTASQPTKRINSIIHDWITAYHG